MSQNSKSKIQKVGIKEPVNINANINVNMMQRRKNGNRWAAMLRCYVFGTVATKLDDSVTLRLHVCTNFNKFKFKLELFKRNSSMHYHAVFIDIL